MIWGFPVRVREPPSFDPIITFDGLVSHSVHALLVNAAKSVITTQSIARAEALAGAAGYRAGDGGDADAAVTKGTVTKGDGDADAAVTKGTVTKGDGDADAAQSAESVRRLCATAFPIFLKYSVYM